MQWQKNMLVYGKLFFNMRKRMPQTFLNAWDTYFGFHDFEVQQVSVVEQSQIIRLKLKKREITILLCFIGCKNLHQISLPFVSDILLYVEVYDSDEYEFHLLFDSEIEMNLICKTIDVTI